MSKKPTGIRSSRFLFPELIDSAELAAEFRAADSPPRPTKRGQLREQSLQQSLERRSLSPKLIDSAEFAAGFGAADFFSQSLLSWDY